MSLSTYCYTLALVELLIGLPLLLRPARTADWFSQLAQNDALVRVVGAIFFVISVLVLIEDFRVALSTEGLIRLLAWLTAVKSLSLCWWPQWHMSISHRMLKITWIRVMAGPISLSFGVLFIVAGISR